MYNRLCHVLCVETNLEAHLNDCCLFVDRFHFSNLTRPQHPALQVLCDPLSHVWGSNLGVKHSNVYCENNPLLHDTVILI